MMRRPVLKYPTAPPAITSISVRRSVDARADDDKEMNAVVTERIGDVATGNVVAGTTLP
jgi:hypothetical protein